MDTVGYGDSDSLPDGEPSIERWARAAHDLLAALGMSRAAIVGHHTGAAIAVEIAAAHSEQVAALVLGRPLLDFCEKACTALRCRRSWPARG
jgi:pimeloyl-ACP methyl ester carboxylesterase